MKRWTLDTRLALGFGGMGLAMAALLAVILFRAPPDRGLFTLLAVGTAAVGTVSVLAWLMVRKELTRLALGLSAEIEAFSETYNQVLAGCRDSAKDARKQEEALQEAAASLEEVTAMTRRNTKHALEASQLADETRSATERGVNDIHAMGDAIAALSSSSGEIARILKVIDGVALQTNLLALNAAVEAARAGERGAGFAVVADEVRNLAQRAAVAARDSGSRIEETLNWISQCEILKGEVVNSLDQIANRTRQLAELAAGVSEATGQQATSVTQASAAFERCDRFSVDDVPGTQADNEIIQACLTRSHTLRQSTQALLGFLGLTIPSNPVLRRSPSSPGRDRSGTRPPPPHHSGGKSTPGSPHLSAAKLEESLSCGDPSSAQSAPNN